MDLSSSFIIEEIKSELKVYCSYWHKQSQLSTRSFYNFVSKFEILQIMWKKLNKEHQTLSFQFLSIDLASILIHMWTAKHLVQAFCIDFNNSNGHFNSWI